MFLVSTVPANKPAEYANNIPLQALDTAGFIRKLQRFGTSGSIGELHVIAPNVADIGQLAEGLEQSIEDPNMSRASETENRKEGQEEKLGLGNEKYLVTRLTPSVLVALPYSVEQPTYREKLAALSMASGIYLPDYNKPPVTLEQLFYPNKSSRRPITFGNTSNGQSDLAKESSQSNSSAYFESLCFYPIPSFSPNSTGVVPEMVARDPFELFSDRGLTKAIDEYKRMRNLSNVPPPPILYSNMEILYHEAVRNYARCHLSHDSRIVYSIEQFYLFNPTISTEFPQETCLHHPMGSTLFKNCWMWRNGAFHNCEANSQWKVLSKLEKESWNELARKLRFERNYQLTRGYICIK